MMQHSNNGVKTRAYGACPTKRARRTKDEIAAIRETIMDVLRKDHPMTDRQLFYQLVTREGLPKEEKQYQGTVCRLVGEMRLNGTLPWDWISDITRRIRRPVTYASPTAALIELVQDYKRDLWAAQDCLVIVMCEKDAMLGVLEEETWPYQVPLVITRGFPSLSLLHELAELIEEQGKPVFIYYFGDHDPSGVWIDRSIEERLNELAPTADITFERVAVLPEQIEELGLPTRPTKNHPKNTHARDFDGDSVELDAIPAATLRAMVRECIERHIDQDALDEGVLVEGRGRRRSRCRPCRRCRPCWCRC
jgi:DNA topoisomerase VI subunit A